MNPIEAIENIRQYAERQIKQIDASYKLVTMRRNEHYVDLSIFVDKIYSTLELKRWDENRSWHYLRARSAIMYYLVRYRHQTLKKVGEVFGKDHSTVIHAINAYQEMMDVKQHDCKDFLQTIIKTAEEIELDDKKFTKQLKF